MQDEWTRVEGHPASCERAKWDERGHCLVTKWICGIEICCGLATCCIDTPHDIYKKATQVKITNTTREDVKTRMNWLHGFQQGLGATTNSTEAVNMLCLIHKDLTKLYHGMCGQGIVGCRDGEGCTSDHK